MAIKVALRKKKISNGRESLYLDFYPPIRDLSTGKMTRREFLSMYILEKPKTPIEKKYNAEQLKIAEGIRQKRENQFNKPEIYNSYELEQLRLREMGEQCFVDYFRKLAVKRKASNHDNWMSALNYLEAFTGGSLRFSELNEKILEAFKEYLLSAGGKRNKQAKLSQNSASSYFNKVKATLKQAYKEGILQTDLNARVESIKSTETKREYLTLQELNKLVKTPCENEVLKRAALFSALTGLRFSDIKKMKWSEIQYIEGKGYFLHFTQQKTKGIEVLPISEQAVQFCGVPQEPTADVFEDLEYSAYQNSILRQWIKDADITKNITFHCFRHTFATLQLFNGTDLYTVSKMLGHKDLKTTQIYAKIVDESKRLAADKIKLDL